MENKVYLVKLLTLDGNEYSVYVTESTERKAISKIEKEYEFDSIISINEVSENIDLKF